MLDAHVLYIASPERIALLEKSIESLLKNGGIECGITAIINSGMSTKKISIKYTDILEDKSHFVDHHPTRWFVKPKSDVCIFLDYDIFVMSSLKTLVETCKIEQKLCGVMVYDQPIKKETLEVAFKDCGVEYKENASTWKHERKIPRCYNYGVLAAPVQIVEKIKNQLAKNILIINETSKKLKSHDLAYYTGQVALSITIHQLNIPVKDMPLRYNFPDCIPEIDIKFPEEKENVICLHSLTKKIQLQKIF